MDHRHFLKVLWSFILYILQRFVFSLKHSHYAYIPPYMHKTLPTLGKEKKQKQIEFYEKLSDDKKSQNNLFHLPAWVSVQKVRLHHCILIYGSRKSWKFHPQTLVAEIWVLKYEKFYKLRNWLDKWQCHIQTVTSHFLLEVSSSSVLSYSALEIDEE